MPRFTIPPLARPTALAEPCPLPLLPLLCPPCSSLLAALHSPLSPLTPLPLSCSLYRTVFFACPVCRAPIRLVIHYFELKVPVPFQGPERTPGGEEQAFLLSAHFEGVGECDCIDSGERKLTYDEGKLMDSIRGCLRGQDEEADLPYAVRTQRPTTSILQACWPGKMALRTIDMISVKPAPKIA